MAVDLGASTGGFTTVLLEAGAARVYAVDAGFGQLLGSLRLDRRVVNLERVNVASLGPERVGEVVDVVTMDLSYLAVAKAARQLVRLRIAADADLVALVKPMYELGLSRPPATEHELSRAVDLARAGLEATGWRVVATIPSPVRGRRGASELLLHARKDAR